MKKFKGTYASFFFWQDSIYIQIPWLSLRRFLKQWVKSNKDTKFCNLKVSSSLFLQYKSPHIITNLSLEKFVFEDKEFLLFPAPWQYILPPYIKNYFHGGLSFGVYDYPSSRKVFKTYRMGVLTIINTPHKIIISFPLREMILGLWFAFLLKMELGGKLREQTLGLLTEDLTSSFLNYLSYCYVEQYVNASTVLSVSLILDDPLEGQSLFFYDEYSKPDGFWLNKVVQDDILAGGRVKP